MCFIIIIKYIYLWLDFFDNKVIGCNMCDDGWKIVCIMLSLNELDKYICLIFFNI